MDDWRRSNVPFYDRLTLLFTKRIKVMAFQEQKRYSEAFKLKVMEELRDGKWKSINDAGRAYGLTGTAISKWMKAIGFDFHSY